MSQTKTNKPKSIKNASKNGGKANANPFDLRESKDPLAKAERLVHVIGDGIICNTDTRGYATPEGRSPLEIVLDATEGFVPLWARNTTLRWRFQERSMLYFERPSAAKDAIRKLFGESVLRWGNAAPVRFAERNDAWDFEIVMRNADDCDGSGCVLASAFFPDAGRHELTFYPRMFTQNREEQIETLIHEIGHVFGLRHFFANISETRWASEIFGTHNPFSIMNYGSQSVLTDADKSDLRRLYLMAWNGELTNVNGTPIRFVKPYHTIGEFFGNATPFRQLETALQPGSEFNYSEETRPILPTESLAQY